MSNHIKGLIIFGCGGHARSVADIALANKITSLIFIDENARENELLFGFPVRREWLSPVLEGWSTFPAAGDNKKRQKQMDFLLTQQLPIASLIAPTATIGLDTSIGAGSLIAHHAHIGPCATIGSGCIINTGAIIEHEVKIDDFTHISVNSTIAGRSRVGKSSFIGASTTVIDNISVGDNIIVGAGGCVVHSLTMSGVYIGIPARKIEK